ncbi:hypothetical protein SAMN04515691_1367 [Leifsonia sp. 98AMF]|uniref:DUF7882 family protein n=1 Tax=Microbacteriaceae TaxID=85023 RepID=UPI00036A1AF2|nr:MULTISPECIES: hypothetical protein [Microbacteriaceae]SDH46539.1 hypothetical protein SAMN04515690_2652 [Leifsonia sp. 197AMF]SDI90969.1 hypothetical protein SAMN04515684_1134 [Leifsonia sp. 466MF]SDJ89065.1 hypothetical protein SAMN04515683_1614 [Leifsonia sp. 157MF]SDN94645.1 hypothetical protein SAMN04515686_3337 [Leifsonia sp. 509MF]SEN10868.1 hypothetical protein SAMN04515685_1599 [Leifsonia sp. 467MF]
MGRLVYGTAPQEYEFDDRTLAHVKIAVVTKLRRHESFLLNWQIPADLGGGRVSLWISRDIPLAFVFSGTKPPRLNDKWMDVLLRTSQRTGGMVVVSEAEAEAIVERDERGD